MKKFNFEKWRKHPTQEGWKKYRNCHAGYKFSYYYGECGEGVKKEFCDTCVSLYENDSMKKLRL